MDRAIMLSVLNPNFVKNITFVDSLKTATMRLFLLVGSWVVFHRGSSFDGPCVYQLILGLGKLAEHVNVNG